MPLISEYISTQPYLEAVYMGMLQIREPGRDRTAKDFTPSQQEIRDHFSSSTVSRHSLYDLTELGPAPRIPEISR